MISLAEITVDFCLNPDLLSYIYYLLYRKLDNDIPINSGLGELTVTHVAFFKRLVESNHVLNHISVFINILNSIYNNLLIIKHLIKVFIFIF